MRALSLFSGGLDSILATRIILEQGIEVTALNYSTVFHCSSKGHSDSEAERGARMLGVELRVVHQSEDLLALVKAPKHGHGKNLNPCIDCRIMSFGKAGGYMREMGASFLVTGEVLGERPMSQRRHAMGLIEKEAGLDGLILRPLSAKLLKPSLPEREGWVDREKLHAIRGRSRKPQMALARHYGITEYPSPAGGCLLTDPGFSNRLGELLHHDADCTVNDVELVRVGRHFRLSPTVKAIVGRVESENEDLDALKREGDTILEIVDIPGPLTLVRGEATPEDLTLAASITVRYSKARTMERVPVAVLDSDGTKRDVLEVPPADETILADMMP